MGELAIATSTYVPLAHYQAYNDQPYRTVWSDTKTSLYIIKVDVPRKVQIASSTTDKTSGAKFSTELTGEQKALNRLRAFKRWGANWDAEGAAEPDGAAIDAATKVLTLLALKNIEPTVMLSAEGKPMFLINQWGLDGEITVSEANELEFFFNSAEPIGDAVPFEEDVLPNALAQIFDAARK